MRCSDAQVATKPKAKSINPSNSKTTESHGTAKARTKKSKADVSQDLDLTRKERSAQIFMQKAMKPSKGNSIFSIRALVEGREGPSHQAGHDKAQLPSAQTNYRPSPTFQKSKTAKASKNDAELIALCKNRDTRDLRTIDEIQKDIKARKAGSLSAAAPQSGAISGSVSPSRHGSGAPVKTKTKVPIPSSARPTQSVSSAGESSRSVSPAKAPAPNTKPKIAIPSSARPTVKSSSPRKRQREESYETDSVTSEDEPVTRKRAKQRGAGGGRKQLDEDEPSRAFISAQIQDLFRRPGRGPPRPVVYSDDESDSDMEAGVTDMEAEERAAARIARLEDEMEERKERERKEAKERMKRIKATGKA